MDRFIIKLNKNKPSNENNEPGCSTSTKNQELEVIEVNNYSESEDENNTDCHSDSEDSTSNESRFVSTKNIKRARLSKTDKRNKKLLRNYKPEWENIKDLKGWLSPNTTNTNKEKTSYCLACNIALRSHIGDLTRHATTTKHKMNCSKDELKQTGINRSQLVRTVNTESKTIDICLAFYIVKHSAMRGIDHLTKLINRFFVSKNRTVNSAEIAMKRTKCTMIIMNVINPAINEIMRDEIGTTKYSIILDESTDVGSSKFMAYCIRYYNKKYQKIMTDFLGIQFVEKATGEILYSRFIEFINECGLKIENMIGIGTDGANNMCGEYNSLYSRLRKNNPHIFLNKCICHSLNLCSQKAASELPSSLEYLLQQTRSWFSNSPLRKLEYQHLYKKIKGENAPQLVSLSNTRWLAFGNAVHQQLQQWRELEKHFSQLYEQGVQNKDKRCFAVTTLYNMFKEKSNYLYLLFLDGILKKIVGVNMVFQSEKISICQAYDELSDLIIFVARSLFKSAFSAVYLSDSSHEQIFKMIKNCLERDQNRMTLTNPSMLDEITYGYSFEKYLTSQEGKEIPVNIIIDVKFRCRQYLITLLKELMQRVPENFQKIKKIKTLEIASVFGYVTKSINLPFELINVDEELEIKIAEQWQILQNSSFKKIMGQDCNIDETSVIDFWITVGQIKDAIGNFKYIELANFALAAYSFPFSNAAVERVFSIMNCIKTKLRNRMGENLLNSLILIRTYMANRNICCENIIPCEKMLSRHNKDMYKKKIQEETEKLVDNVNNEVNDEEVNDAISYVTLHFYGVEDGVNDD